MNLLIRFREMKLENKLMLLSSVLMSYVSTSQISKTINSEVLSSTKELNQTEFLSYKIGKSTEVSDAIVLDGNLNEMLTRSFWDYSLAQ